MARALRNLFFGKAEGGASAKALPSPVPSLVPSLVPSVTPEMRAYAAWSGLRCFRSAPFRLDGSIYQNHEEYREAVRQPDQAWMVRRVSAYDGLADRAAQERMIETAVMQKDLCFYEALYLLAEYEATQADLYRLSGVTRLEMPAGAVHFRDAGHGEAFIFDVRGYPHQTAGGLPLDDARFTARERELAAALSRAPFLPSVRHGVLNQMFPSWKMEAADPGHIAEVQRRHEMRENLEQAARSIRLIRDEFRAMEKEGDAYWRSELLGIFLERPVRYISQRAGGVVEVYKEMEGRKIMRPAVDVAWDLRIAAQGMVLAAKAYSGGDVRDCAAKLRTWGRKSRSLPHEAAGSLEAYLWRRRTADELKDMMVNACARAVCACDEIIEYLGVARTAVLDGVPVAVPDYAPKTGDVLPAVFSGARLLPPDGVAPSPPPPVPPFTS